MTAKANILRANEDARKISEAIIRRLEMYERDATFGTGLYSHECGNPEGAPQTLPGRRKLIPATMRWLKARVRSAQRPLARWIVYLLDLWLEAEQRERQGQ